MVDIEPIWRALGKEKAQVLLYSMHLLEQTIFRKFSGIGKTKWFQADVHLPRALMKPPMERDLS